MRQDRLLLRNILCHCRIGVTDAERGGLQKIEVDLELYADLAEAGKTGELRRTIDYREVCQTVRDLLETSPFSLIETAATRILDRVLEQFPTQRAVVRVRKFILPEVGYVEIQMERAMDT